MAAGHVGGRPGLIDEDQPFRIEVGPSVEPGSALARDFRAVLLDSVARLFFRVNPRRCKNRDGAELDVAISRAASRSHSPTSV
jgi:hypothetical protein